MGAVRWSLGTAGALLVVLVAGSCSSDGGDDGDCSACGSSGEGSVFGHGGPIRDPDVAERIATKVVEGTVGSCGGRCTADFETGRQLLSEGRMLQAFDAFACGDTPERAFGAGIARVLSVVESEHGDAVLKSFGLEPMPASDLFGAQGLLARHAARWNGRAQLKLSGGVELELDSDRVAVDDYDLRVSTYQGSRRISFAIETEASLSMAGAVIAPMYDCQGSGLAQGSVPYVQLTVDDGDRELDCSLPRSLPAQRCQPSGGSLRVVAAGDQPGDHVEYELTNLLLDCSEVVYVDDDRGGAPLAPPAPSAGSIARVSGTVKANVVLKTDTSGLHALLQGKEGLLLAHARADATSDDLMSAAAGVAGEIAAARCYFAKAAQGSGAVFTLPGAIYGGDDLPLGPGDARMLGAAASFAAATVEAASAYEIGLPMQQLACSMDDGLDEVAKCGSTRAFVDAVNGKVKAAVLRHERMAAAKALLEVALEDFEQGVEQLDADSALVRDETSMPGWNAALELVQAAQQALEGRRAVPHLAPAAHIDLAAFFASPPEPAKIARPALLYREDCEDGNAGECYRDVDLDVDYADAFFAPYSDLDWDGEYEWDGTTDSEMEDALDRIRQQLRDKGLNLDD